MHKLGVVLLALGAAALVAVSASAHIGETVESPKLTFKPAIDGDLADWEDFAWTNGIWDWDRFRLQPWNTASTRLLDSTVEPEGTQLTALDLTTEYQAAWDDDGLYMGIKVIDNVHDVVNSMNDDSRWYFKDATSWYFDVPHDGDGGVPMEGDHVFTFVADDTYPAGGTWWRHGEAGQALEVPGRAGWQYAVAIDPATGTNYAIEVFVPFAESFWVVNANFRPAVGTIIGGGMIVTPDPDGGEADFGGQYVWGSGGGDNDGLWADYMFAAGEVPVAVESSTWAQVKGLFR